MAERLTHLLMLLVALLACSSTKTESHVSVPITLEAVKELHDPPGVAVAVERKTRSSGGGNCGHSPVCILVLPVMLVNGLFPTEWDEATVTTAGKISYRASFTTDGKFVDSTEFGAKKVSNFGALELKELKKRVIVKISEADIGSGGKPGPARRVKILPQVDLIAEYEAALKKESDADDRAKLISEAVAWLGVESTAFLQKRMTDTAEPDESRGEVLGTLCRRSETDTALVLAALEAAVKQPTPQVARAGASCGLKRKGVPARAEFTRALAEQVCADTAGNAELHVKVLEALPRAKTWAQVEATTQACKEVSARLTLRHVFGQPVGSKELVEAVADETPHGHLLFYRLDPQRPAERPAVFAGLVAYPGSERMVERVAGSRPASSAELEVLARNYPVDAAGFDGPRRAHVLRAFNKAREAKVSSGAARSVMEAAVEAAEDDDRPMFRIALVVLGDRSQAASASRGLNGGGIPRNAGDVLDTSGLVAWGLGLAGCDRAGVSRAYKASHRLKDSARGALCTR